MQPHTDVAAQKQPKAGAEQRCPMRRGGAETLGSVVQKLWEIKADQCGQRAQQAGQTERDLCPAADDGAGPKRAGRDLHATQAQRI